MHRQTLLSGIDVDHDNPRLAIRVDAYFAAVAGDSPDDLDERSAASLESRRRKAFDVAHVTDRYRPRAGGDPTDREMEQRRFRDLA
jgi:hypothetical protein